MREVELEHVEPLNSTEQIMVFTTKFDKKKVGMTYILNVVFLESKKEDNWKHVDDEISNIVDKLAHTTRKDLQ